MASTSTIRRSLAYSVSAIAVFGTIYSIIYNTYLDTSDPLISHLPHPLGKTHYFANKKNFLNVYFVKFAWAWTTAVFAYSWATSPKKVAPRRGSSTATQRLLTYISLTVVWLLFTGWFFGPAILERVTVMSGGECVLPGPQDAHLVLPTEFCFTKSTVSVDSHPELFQTLLAKTHADGNLQANLEGQIASIKGVPRLRKGHDVSGHIFLLTLSVLLLGDELNASFQARAQGRNWSPLHSAAVAVNATLIGVWLLAVVTTSVYFHSPLEKLTGLALGLASYGMTQIPIGALFSPQEEQGLSAPTSTGQSPGTSRYKNQ